MKKRILSLVLVLSLALLGGCGNSAQDSSNTGEGTQEAEETETTEESGEATMEFVYVTQDSANPYFIEVYNGFETKCQELGITTQLLDSKYDVATQVSFVEDAVQRGVDGIMISPLDENALKTVVDQAKEKGIVVSAEAQPISNAQIDGSLDEYGIGYAIACAAAEWINTAQDGQVNALTLA